MNIYEKLLRIQAELKAPKNQTNSFGKYNYRSCEDILESVKPLLNSVQATLNLSDEIVLIGDRYYVKATATLSDIEGATHQSVFVTAFAREGAEKKGMDDSQITGAASSYARKYALNGLFCIDDNKDADTNEYRNVQNAGGAKSSQKGVVCQRCKKNMVSPELAAARKAETKYVLCDECYEVWARIREQDAMAEASQEGETL